MAIIKSFGGARIRKPGSYSISRVDQSGGAPLGANGTLFILGEAETGAPGDIEGLKKFSASQLSDLVAEYSSGPLVDCAKAALVSPSKTPGVGQADEVIIWKTNSSTKASADFDNATPDPQLTISGRNYGLPGNSIAIKIENGTDATKQRIISIKKGDTIQVLDENDAQAQLSIQYTGAGTAATLTVSGTLTAKTLATTVTGASGEDLSIDLSQHTIKSLQEYIDSQSAYTATLLNSAKGSITEALDLDPYAAIDIKTSAQSLYRLQQEIVDRINEDAVLVEAELIDFLAGIPATASYTFLSGGAKGASTSTDFSQGMSKSLAADYNVALPAISRDATADIADGLTDSSSTYDIDAVHAALDTHLRLRGSVKNRKEAQGMVGHRDSTVANSYAAAQTLNSELIQMFIQDVLVVDINGDLSWKQPHVAAALAAGTRLGTDVGEPLTHKFMNCSGIGHVVDSTDGLPDGDFDPFTDVDSAIDAGVSFMEQAAGGFRIVVDNTAYGKDQSFVFNRGSVVEAAQYVAKTLRETAELVFVGQKVSNGIAKSIKSVLRSKLLELNQANIITQSDDAPNGFREDTFVVTINGNTANVSVHVKPVQGLDFVLIQFELGDITQSA